MPILDLFTLAEYMDPQQPAPVSDYNRQFLAQGDSWFSIGAIPPGATTNLFEGMGMSIRACAVNCAKPGWTLQRMVDRVKDPKFNLLLTRDRVWSGMLFSGGGNDLIDAVNLPPSNSIDMRLLLKRDEWSSDPDGEKFISNPGWATFSAHLIDVVNLLLKTRDSGPCKGIRIVMHTYDIVAPRDVPAGFGVGPWLYPAMQAYEIPQENWMLAADALMRRLRTLLHYISHTVSDGSIFIVDSQGTLEPAPVTSTGPTDDWENEIHPTRSGYRRLGALWEPMLDAVF
jgi:hypothetical protein